MFNAADTHSCIDGRMEKLRIVYIYFHFKALILLFLNYSCLDLHQDLHLNLIKYTKKVKTKALTMDSHLTDEYKQTRSRQLQVESADPVNIRNVKF